MNNRLDRTCMWLAKHRMGFLITPLVALFMLAVVVKSFEE